MTKVEIDYQLDDRYRRVEGELLLTGIQALSRVPVDQLRLDRAAGLDTAAFLSGYPGSPLGGLDQEIARAVALNGDLPIVHRPAVNEELGATAVMGSQLASSRPDATRDGVVGFWYGKAPGLDRAGDALRHGVFAGAAPLGGAVVLVGDDPSCKSSTMPSSSDATLVDLHMPILYPGNAAECLELGLHAVAVSRASGLWASMKIVTAVADGSGLVRVPALDREPELPTVEVDGKPWRCTPSAQFLGPRMLEVEREFREIRLPLAQRYGVVNGLNRVTVDPPDAWIGLVATGFTYHELRDALRRLGLGDERALADAGIRLLQLRMPVPLDPAVIRTFARGLDEIVVMEEKNPTLEWLVKDALYGGADQPLVVGKTDEDGSVLMRAWGSLDADAIVDGLRRRLARRLGDRLVPAPAPERERILIPLTENRSPYFCSGCPHSWGTRVPEGALVGAGTGCHGMTLLMDPERVGDGIGITAMGNEGVQWLGMEPFVAGDHLFQNYGDGTYFHSGQLAIQNCIGAGVSVTFKILYNGTVAMTGGQDSPAGLGVPELASILLTQGVARVVVTADDPDRYRGVSLPDGVAVRHRRDIVAVQDELRAVRGVTVLIHDQRCAAELRRDRKRGLAPTPTRRVVINHRVCEGCGDCGDVSGCLSLRPIDTPLGRKTAVDQASCNYDESCLDGDCPAFSTVEAADSAASGAGGGGPRPDPDRLAPLPDPPARDGRDRVRIRMAGIGGTGVVTAAQILATAAMFDGWDVRGLDQTGLSQKAGPVVSDVILGPPGQPASNLVGRGQADVVLAFDGLVGAGDRVIDATDPSTTTIIASTHRTPTGRMVLDPSLPYPTDAVEARLAAAADLALTLDAAAVAAALTGSAAPTNLVVLGVGVQTGAVPVTPGAVERAIELNGVAVEANLAAFSWGRRWATDRDTVETLVGRGAGAGPTLSVPALPRRLTHRLRALDPGPLAGLLTTLTADLVAYQDAAYASVFVDEVAATLDSERRVDPSSTRLSEAVARNLHKLMAYKDEYEVARLLLAPEATAAAEAVAGPGARVTWHLHPPLLRALGLRSKLALGPSTRPALLALRAGKRLRGTALDPFGRAALRRTERALIEEYVEVVAGLRLRLDGTGDRGLLDRLVAIAELPDTIRGYEDLKARRIAAYRDRLVELLADLDRLPAGS